ncbi:hypothetical protein BGZ80_001547 [Entomortierella chlamydospora]|uniref:MIR domain-containing protein n=1 Tax=Entomortierella chlamydospora TaxID=101097 RepID=A0A9P6MQV2_9FUNG|nr:hypothetical protein BGZ79_004087 [Entomortierella chlamydospora]KAG0010363.1 hypothetical protein BGZ80_001547 [Entomortierella chlamydospora]
MPTPQITQKFRSPIDGRIVAIRAWDDVGYKFVLWKHILQSFGDDVRVLRAGDVDIHCMLNKKFEDLLPLRIQYVPDTILDVILNEEPSLSVKDKNEEPPLSVKEKNEEEKKLSIEKSVLPAYSSAPNDDYIRFGSRIYLRHVDTCGFLRTPNLHYRVDLGQSDQYIVYNFHSLEPDREDWWEVTAPKDEKDHVYKLPYGSRLRLFHVDKRRWLHSHYYKSPVTPNQQEVTGFGNAETSDANDVWIVERVEGCSEFWRTSDVFILRHEATNRYLHSHPVRCYGEKEVVAFDKRNDINNLWRAQFP